MMKRVFVALAATLVLSAGLAATRAEAATATCDRACLKGMIDTYLKALVAHRPGDLPTAPGVRFTEDSNPAKLGDGLWKTASGLGAYRQDYLDVRDGVAGAHVVVQEGAAPVFLAVRLKVADRKITEVETQVTRSEKEGSLFSLKELSAVSPRMNLVPAAAQKNSRADVLRIANFYPAGLKADSFVKVDMPVAADANRVENGVVTAGPSCVRSEACKVLKTQPLIPGRTAFTQRVLAVDEDLGIAWLRMSWARGEGTRLVVYEAFKVYDGKIQAVEAFMRFNPLAQTSGWD